MSAGNKGSITLLSQLSLAEIPSTSTSTSSNSVTSENDNQLLVPSTSTTATTAETAIFVTSSTASTASNDNPSTDAPEIVTS